MKSSNNRYNPGDLIEIGRIVGAHGIKGAVKVYSYAESDTCFSPRDEIALVGQDGARSWHTIIDARPYKNIVRLTVDRVTTRNQAEELVGCRVVVPKSDLPPLEDDTYYWADIIGMSVYTTDDCCLGKVASIIPTGANDVYVVKGVGDDSEREILIPAIASVVLDIDTSKSLIRVELPEGLAEL